MTEQTSPRNKTGTTLNTYFVIGESSGDNLGADLLTGFDYLDVPVNPIGLGGEKMQVRGLVSLFDISELSVMGLSGVVAKLPRLMSLVRKTAADIIARQPDVVLLIDSPEFAFAVAKRVRRANPNIPIIKYVCPSVWAWRPGRAVKLRRYLDHILAILPFEPEVLETLDGPPATYIGHPLASLIEENAHLDKRRPGELPLIAICPGSRKSELTRMLPVMRETLDVLSRRGNRFTTELPAVPHLEQFVRNETRSWENQPKIVLGDDGRADLFKRADVALAASGTVTLELAVYKVPLVSTYKLDNLMLLLQPLMNAWTASLPNLIADTAFIPEKFNKYANCENIARTLEEIMVAGPAREAQLLGFEKVAQNMKLSKASNLAAVETICQVIENKKAT